MEVVLALGLLFVIWVLVIWGAAHFDKNISRAAPSTANGA